LFPFSGELGTVIFDEILGEVRQVTLALEHELFFFFLYGCVVPTALCRTPDLLWTALAAGLV
jgi:hypothetical protein